MILDYGGHRLWLVAAMLVESNHISNNERGIIYGIKGQFRVSHRQFHSCHGMDQFHNMDRQENLPLYIR